MRTSPKMIYTQLAVPAWPINPAEPIDGSLSSPPTRNCIHRKHNEFPKSSMNPGESEDGGSDKFRYPTSYIRTPNPEQRGPELPSSRVPNCVAPQGRLGALTLFKLSLSWVHSAKAAPRTQDPYSRENWLRSFAIRLERVCFFRGCSAVGALEFESKPRGRVVEFGLKLSHEWKAGWIRCLSVIAYIYSNKCKTVIQKAFYLNMYSD